MPWKSIKRVVKAVNRQQKRPGGLGRKGAGKPPEQRAQSYIRSLARCREKEIT